MTEVELHTRERTRERMREGTPKTWPAASHNRIKREQKKIEKDKNKESARKAKASEKTWRSMPEAMPGRTHQGVWTEKGYVLGAASEPPRKRTKGTKPGLSSSAGPYFKK